MTKIEPPDEPLELGVLIASVLPLAENARMRPTCHTLRLWGRRAAKRGRSVEEEKAAERKKEKEKKERVVSNPNVTQQEQQPSAEQSDDPGSKRARTVGLDVWKARGLEAVQNAGKMKRDEKAGWFCTAMRSDKSGQCGFINFSFRATCKQCNTLRYGAPEKQVKQQSPPASEIPSGRTVHRRRR